MQDADQRRVLAFSAAVALVCASAFPRLRGLEALHHVAVPAAVGLIALFALAETTLIHVPLRRDTHTVSFNEVPLVLGLFLLSPSWLVIGAAAATAVTLRLHRRQRGAKLLFNTVQVGAQCVVATAVFRTLLASSGPASIRAYGAAFVAGVVADFTSALLVTVAISLYRGEWAGTGTWSLMFGVMASAAKSALAIVAVSLTVNSDALVLVPLTCSAACMYAAFRGHAALFERHRRLEMLYRFTSAVGRSVNTDEIAVAIVDEARELLRACRAELVVHDSAGSSRAWSSILDDELPPETAVQEIANDRVLPNGASFTLSVADPLGVDRSFDEVDTRLFDGLCAHAAVALANCDLVEQLSEEIREREYRATHDVSTGLVNQEQVVAAAEQRISAGERVTILVISVDDITDIEQTVGYHNGELLLATLARRIEASVADVAVVARLRGSKFGVLTTPDRLDTSVRLVKDAVSRHIGVDGLRLFVTVTMGYASAPDDAEDARGLLRCADGGLRAASRDYLRIARHEPGSEHEIRRRLTLAQELHRAIPRRELAVFFQPQVVLATGEPAGAEALVRWNHPSRGLVQPDEFIPVAEHTGLIVPLTDFVLTEALAQRRKWVDTHQRELGISVNISPRSFGDSGFVEKVMRALVRARCPADVLTLELTETQLMADPNRAARVLSELHDVGIRISIDDFGTGYSSLTSLRSLPLDEVKIDKSFVFGLPDNENDALIVRSITGLARSLDLSVVVEGIEHEAARRFLLDAGLTIAQGYLFGKPVDAEQFELWLCSRLEPARHLAETAMDYRDGRA